MKNKTEYIFGLVALLLIIFTILNSYLESKINQINSDSMEFLIQSNFDISRAVATSNLMEDTITFGIASNDNLIDIITSENYLNMFNNRKEQILSANTSFNNYRLKKDEIIPIRKTYCFANLIHNILAILNVVLAILLIRRGIIKHSCI